MTAMAGRSKLMHWLCGYTQVGKLLKALKVQHYQTMTFTKKKDFNAPNKLEPKLRNIPVEKE